MFDCRISEFLNFEVVVLGCICRVWLAMRCRPMIVWLVGKVGIQEKKALDVKHHEDQVARVVEDDHATGLVDLSPLSLAVDQEILVILMTKTRKTSHSIARSCLI